MAEKIEQNAQKEKLLNRTIEQSFRLTKEREKCYGLNFIIIEHKTLNESHENTHMIKIKKYSLHEQIQPMIRK